MKRERTTSPSPSAPSEGGETTKAEAVPDAERPTTAAGGKGKIKVDVMWGLGFIWNSEDVETLKRDHNIHGSAVGACPGHQQQNDVHGLPVQIQAEAVQYLLEKGVVELDCGKRGDGESPPDVADEAFMKRLKEKEGYIECPLVRGAPVFDTSGHEGSKLDVDPSKFRVYRHMKDKGYAITGGRKFGADYLMYETSPEDAHAIVTLRVHSLHQPLDPLQIIASARVAHGARKHLVIASTTDGGTDAPPLGIKCLTFSPEGGFSELDEEGEEGDMDDLEENPEEIPIDLDM